MRRRGTIFYLPFYHDYCGQSPGKALNQALPAGLRMITAPGFGVDSFGVSVKTPKMPQTQFV